MTGMIRLKSSGLLDPRRKLCCNPTLELMVHGLLCRSVTSEREAEEREIYEREGSFNFLSAFLDGSPL